MGWWVRFRDPILLALLATVVLCGLWIFAPVEERNDSTDYACCYEPVARNLVDGLGLYFPNGKFADHYPPGFSLLLALIFEAGRVTGEDFAYKVFVVLCSLLGVWCVWGIGRLLGGRALGLLSGAMLATYPFWLWLQRQPNPETPYIPLVLAGVYCGLRAIGPGGSGGRGWVRWALGSGVMFGLACMVRPAGLPLAFAMAGGAMFALRLELRRRLVTAVLIVAGFVVSILPWELTVWQMTGKVVLLSGNSGVGLKDGLVWAIEPRHPIAISPEVRRLMEAANQRTEEISKLGGYVKFVASQVGPNPKGVLGFIWLKVTRVWYGTDSNLHEMEGLVVQLPYTILSFLGLWLLARREPGATAGMVLITLACWGMAALIMPLLRYMVPVNAMLMAPAAATVMWLAGKIWPEWNPDGFGRTVIR